MTNEAFKSTLWNTANILRGCVAAAEYKYPVLALVFLKYVSDLFKAQAKVIEHRTAEPESPMYVADPELRAETATELASDRDAYTQDNVFWVPDGSRYEDLLAHIAADDLAQRLDKAMKAIEDENPELAGVLYRDFGRLELEAGKLSELMKELAKLKFAPATHRSRDIFGEVYEYFLGEFARAEGAKAGEFYTPKSVVNLLVEILAPFKGKIYDPACGSGGMFVQSVKFMHAHEKKLGKDGDLPIYGQELMATYTYCAFSNKAVIDYVTNLSGGTRMPRTNWKQLASFPAAIPPDSVADAFNKLAAPMLQFVADIGAENRKLSELRDTLLPRLISGKLRLPEAAEAAASIGR